MMIHSLYQLSISLGMISFVVVPLVIGLCLFRPQPSVVVIPVRVRDNQ